MRLAYVPRKTSTHTLLALRKLGCALWLIGDPSHQLTAIGDQWHGADLTGDISDTAMLRSAFDCKRFVFYRDEEMRCKALQLAEQFTASSFASHCARQKCLPAPRSAAGNRLVLMSPNAP